MKRIEGKLDLAVSKIDGINSRLNDVRHDYRATQANIWVVGLGLAVLIVGAIAFVATSSYALARDPSQVRAFRLDHACPATGKAHGPCNGWVVDHIIPLCAGGKDAPSNMQWQSKPASFEKDEAEWKLCVWIRRAR